MFVSTQCGKEVEGAKRSIQNGVPEVFHCAAAADQADMFIHKNQLEYQLSSEHYQDPDFYQIELERLFLPAWHLVCRKAELANHGDFFTTELFDRPIIIRNDNGELYAFLNVCSHRHCKIRSEERGNSPQLKCQYHGWEYKMTGFTATIPDARCFRPFDRENARLQKFRVDTCGDSVFVSLQKEGPSLQEFMGDFYFIWQALLIFHDVITGTGSQSSTATGKFHWRIRSKLIMSPACMVNRWGLSIQVKKLRNT
ncbi:MAG: Rieske (2Fe-2S) protein [Planctomycetaceae bacterium]